MSADNLLVYILSESVMDPQLSSLSAFENKFKIIEPSDLTL